MSPPPSPSGSPRPGLSPQLGLGLLLLALAMVRLLAAGFIPLTEDEAYYRLWAQHPHLGYYDHPPMVAWWVHAGVTLAGDNALGVRLYFALASVATSWIVYKLAASGGSARNGVLAAILYNATLTIGVGAMLAAPDVAAGLFWALTLLALVRSTRNPRWWLLAGATAGLACLSKYSALFLAPGVVLWLAATPEGRRRLLTPWPWLAAVIAVAIFGLNIGWNATHHFETFHKQFGRVGAHRLAPAYLLEFLAGQFVLLNPAVAILAGLGAVRAWRGRGEAAGGAAWLMAAAAAPFLAYLLLHSLHDRVQAHWPAPLYVNAAVLAAGVAGGANGWRRGLATWAPVGLALSLIALLHLALPPTDFGRRDPAVPFRAWPAFAKAVDAQREAAGAAWVGTLSYGVSAQLQAARQSEAPILQIDERDRYQDLSAPDAPDLSRPGLIVDLKRRLDPARLRACFAAVGSVSELDRGPSLANDARYAAVAVADPKVDILTRGCGD